MDNMDESQMRSMAVVGFNMFTSTAIVTANKLFFMSYRVAPNYLAATHLTCAYLALRLSFWYLNKPINFSIFDEQVMTVGFLNAGAIAFQSISFIHCSVATMQILKLLVMPFLVVAEYYRFGTWKPNRFPSLGVICLGVIVGGLGDQQHTTFWGPFVVGAGCIFTTFYSTSMKLYCKDRGCKTLDLFVPSIPTSVVSALIFGALFDRSTGADVDLFFSTPEPHFLLGLGITSLLAVAINVTTAIIMVELSPLTYVILNPVKTALAILVGVIMTGQYPVMFQYFGIPISLVGVAWYSYEGYKESLLPK